MSMSAIVRKCARGESGAFRVRIARHDRKTRNE